MLLTAVQIAGGWATAFAESGLGVGVILPGESVIVVLAAAMPSSWAVVALLLAVAAGSAMGDHLGFWVGRRYGSRLRDSRVVARVGVRHFDRATDLMRRRGAGAVLTTRLLPVVRTLTPAAAGISGLAYRRFLPASIAGSLLWSGLYVGGGTVLVSVWSATEDALGRAVWLVLGAVLAVALPLLALRSVLVVRPAGPALDVLRAEAERPAPRRATFSPLIGDVQI